VELSFSNLIISSLSVSVAKKFQQIRHDSDFD